MDKQALYAAYRRLWIRQTQKSRDGSMVYTAADVAEAELKYEKLTRDMVALSKQEG